MAKVVIRKSNRLRRLRKIPWPIAIIITAFVLSGIFAPFLAPHDPQDFSLTARLHPPLEIQAGKISDYPLGTDQFGRDILSRLIYGSRVSLLIVLVSLLIGGGIGSLIGVVSGYMGGKVDMLLARLVDISLSFPAILIAFLLAVVLGASTGTLILVLVLVVWARFARVIRSEVLTIKQAEYVIYARICGWSTPRILAVHIFPNLVDTIMVLVSLNVGWVILVEASLSFLGAGIPPPTPTWGQMVAGGREYITNAWWIAILPGAAIALVVMAFNLLGDWLRDTLDPKLRQV